MPAFLSECARPPIPFSHVEVFLPTPIRTQAGSFLLFVLISLSNSRPLPVLIFSQNSPSYRLSRGVEPLFFSLFTPSFVVLIPVRHPFPLFSFRRELSSLCCILVSADPFFPLLVLFFLNDSRGQFRVVPLFPKNLFPGFLSYCREHPARSFLASYQSFFLHEHFPVLLNHQRFPNFFFPQRRSTISALSFEFFSEIL